MKSRGTVAVALLFITGFGAWADDVPRITRIDPPKRMLFLGNSFTYFNDGVPLHLRQLAIVADKANASAYEYTMATISGAYLRDLEPFMPLIKSEAWDIVVLQGQSQEPITNKEESERFRGVASKFDRAIRDAK